LAYNAFSLLYIDVLFFANAKKAKPPVETGGCLPKLTAYEKISN
jgi:hypothetical protein